ncbi:helix-turn-helix domain-containing protein [Kocuria marina]|uniref:helix-turn-helix domain-containing protein n=1 Tax=Kocuria marina TaxID=223184 RepID=UPI0012EC4283|nr:helix-turn-helix transcriptional regulator [Kocuria marina]
MVDDIVIGQNVAKLRGGMSMPQRDLAARMRDRGWKWVQSTAASVEKGERPLRLREADDLAGILDCSIEDLMHIEDRNVHVQELREVDKEVSNRFLELHRPMQNYLESFSTLDASLAAASSDFPTKVLESAEATLNYCTPHNLVSNCIQRVVAEGPAMYSTGNWFDQFGGVSSVVEQMTGLVESKDWRNKPRPVYGEATIGDDG